MGGRRQRRSDYFDVMMPDGNGLESLPELLKRPGLPVIIISAQNNIMTAINNEADTLITCQNHLICQI